MNTTHSPIAVLGATGAQGGPVVEALLRAGRPVRAIARTPEKLEALAERGVEVVALDLADEAALTAAFAGVAGVVSHLPFVPVLPLIEQWSRSLAGAVAAAGVPLLVHTASGPIPSEPTGVASFDTKLAADRILQAASLPLVVLEPTGYLGNISAPFSAPSIVHEGELRYPLPAEHRQAWISVEDQATIALAALERPDLAGQRFRIGTQATGREIAEAISAARGRPVTYVPLEPRAFGDTLAAFMGPEAGDAPAADDTALSNRGPELRLDDDTTAATTALGVRLTPLACWASSVDWDAVA